MFDYDYLMRAKIKHMEILHCQKSINDVRLSKLIGPYETIFRQSNDEFLFNKENLTYDLYEISSRLLERKHGKKLEDQINDDFTDALRYKGYQVSDQTRTGKSKINSGEVDIMIRNSKGMPISIIEALKLDLFGLGNKTIIEHINKLVLDYDTNGLEKNYIFVYSTANNFESSWQKYQDYLQKLPHHHLFDSNIKMEGITLIKELSKKSNIKVLSTLYKWGDNTKEIIHFFLNFSK
jgi:hypothetical protein